MSILPAMSDQNPTPASASAQCIADDCPCQRRTVGWTPGDMFLGGMRPDDALRSVTAAKIDAGTISIGKIRVDAVLPLTVKQAAKAYRKAVRAHEAAVTAHKDAEKAEAAARAAVARANKARQDAQVALEKAATQ